MLFMSLRIGSPFIFCCLLFCSLIASCVAPGGKIVRGTLHGDHLWQGVVFVEGDVTLDADAKLKILPGTKILFLPPADNSYNRTEHPYFPGSELNVRGNVFAVGTPDKPIIFAAADPAASQGYWGAVNMDGSQESVFEYCIFRQADSAVHSRQSNVYIEHSIFENNLVGVRFHDSMILVENNLFRDNHTGIRFHFGSPVICENVFRENDVNIFVTSYPRDYLIENNTFGPAAEYRVVLGEQVPDDVNMLRNYWSRSESEPLENSFYDGRRSQYIGRVLTDPVRTTPSSQAGPSWTP
jgi:hypothetical protein